MRYHGINNHIDIRISVATKFILQMFLNNAIHDILPELIVNSNFPQAHLPYLILHLPNHLGMLHSTVLGNDKTEISVIYLIALEITWVL